MTPFNDEQAARFGALLLDWFEKNGRDLPWRNGYSPYQVWISEIMLQQTQMERGVAYFKRWMERFPDPASVARATEDEVLAQWEGLGYYSRARNLRLAAREIMAVHEGKVPGSLHELRALPGIGDYTAGAVASLAFNLPVPAVDANVERVFSRLMDIDRPLKDKAVQTFVREQAGRLIPEGKARLFNQALMELGALVCARKPDCLNCPVAGLCRAHGLGLQHSRPVARPGKGVIQLTMVTGVLAHQGGIFLQKRMDDDVWAGLWEFPGGVVEEGEGLEQALKREYMEELEFEVRPVYKAAVIKHAYTRYRVTLHCYVCGFANGPTRPVLHAAQASAWVRPDRLGEFALPSPHRKLAGLLERDMRFKTLI